MVVENAWPIRSLALCADVVDIAEVIEVVLKGIVELVVFFVVDEVRMLL